MRRSKTRPSPVPGTAVIYARFSSSKQREASIEDQLRVCRSWCAENGYEVVAEYCDHARSGRSDDRPEFQRMVANAGESEVVLVYMMDRFSRDRYDAPIYKKRLRDAGVRVVSATEVMPDGPESMIIESVYEAMAAMESAHTSQRTRRGMEGNALKCMHNGVALFGYDLGEDGMYHVNEAEAEVVREMFSRRARGESFAAIADDLAGRGVESTMHRPCSPQMVAMAVRNEKYVGVYQWGDTRVEGGMPAIVDRDLFDAAGRVRTQRRRHEDWNDYAFSGKAVCAGCGSHVVGVSGHSQNGAKYTYYRCSRRCGVRPVRAEVVEGAVAREIRAMLAVPDRVREIAEAIVGGVTETASDARLMAAERSRDEASAAISNLMRAVERGMDYEDVRERLAALKAQVRRAEADMELWSGLVRVEPDLLAEFLSRGDGMTDRQLLDAFVWRAIVGDGRVVAVLNYREEGEPVRLEVPTGSHKIGWLPSLLGVRTDDITSRPSYKLSDRSVMYVMQRAIALEVSLAS